MGDVSTSLHLKGSLGDVDRQIRARIVARGYDHLRYFAVPGGFGITTQVERFQHNGDPAAERWVVGKTAAWAGFMQYLSNLVFGEEGQFRLFAIVVTPEDIRPAAFGPTETDIARWNASGLPYLSRMRAQQSIEPGTRAWLLVYEFKSSHSKGATIQFDQNGGLPFATHARSLGLL
jgi:hypothetical protein